MDGRFVGAPSMSPQGVGEDDLLLGLAQKHKGIEDLLHTLMTFLERQSDLFYVKERLEVVTRGRSQEGEGGKGFKEGEARELSLKPGLEG